jgi:hypothetical protein
MRLFCSLPKGEEFVLWGVHPIVHSNQKIHFLECIMGDVVLEITNLIRRFDAFTTMDATTLSVNARRGFKVWKCKAQPGLHIMNSPTSKAGHPDPVRTEC